MSFQLGWHSENWWQLLVLLESPLLVPPVPSFVSLASHAVARVPSAIALLCPFGLLARCLPIQLLMVPDNNFPGPPCPQSSLPTLTRVSEDSTWLMLVPAARGEHSFQLSTEPERAPSEVCNL